MKILKIRPLVALSLFIFILSCNDFDDEQVNDFNNNSPITVTEEIPAEINLYDNEGPHEHNFSPVARTNSFTETFESGTKTSYANGSVNLSSGTWFFANALLGDLTNDRKFGSKAARITGTSSYIIMSFNMDFGAETILIRHAKYGSDSDSAWRLIASYDDGANWSFVGNTITTNSTTLNTVSITLNERRAVRYGIYKTDGTGRINIDNIEIKTSGSNSSVATRDSNLTFGNPSDASTSNANYFLSRSQYTLSYNNNRGTSNWVSWHLSSAWTGSTPRCDCFKSDTALPSNFYSPDTNDYVGSGFDRGHLCASADRNGNTTDNEATYFTSNIAPQAPDNNQKSWADFEIYLRSLTAAGNEVHIIAGVAGSGGTGSNGAATTISNSRITVPDSFWKVALILPNGSNDITRVTTSTRVIAINVPNDQGISTSWTSFRTSVNAIEALTGYDLLENISDSVENVIEARVDNGPSN
ncbi:MAG: DNA/RNA non-specific endonuclease [Flavobacterium sp.]|nr:DNA/RNA non-specific endonuclease [Flavobacterium sp.]